MAAIHTRLTFANVMSISAVFIALGGSAWAISKNSVGSNQIKPNAIKNSKIADNAVRSPEVADGSLLGQDFAAGELPEGAPGAQGPAGQQGPPGPSTGPAGGDLTGNYPNPQVGTNTIASGEVTDDGLTAADLGAGSVTASEIASNQVASADLGDVVTRSTNTMQSSPGSIAVQASCLPGEELLGGGGGYGPDVIGLITPPFMISSQRVGVSQTWEVIGDNPTGSNKILTADAICLQ